MEKKTKILATVGPASNQIATLEALIKAGVNVFRMNFSHGSCEDHSKVLANIRQASENSGVIVGILQDICGPKVRVNTLPETFHLQPGDHLHLHKEQLEGYKGDDGYHLSINQPDILTRIQVGEGIYFCDGKIHTKVVAIGSPIIVEVQMGGELSSNKGVNFPHTKININVITPKDKVDLKWGVDNDVDFVAISFVQTADDVKQAREILRSYGSEKPIFSKIEKFDAVENIDEIIKHSDGIMVARGDLGIEVPYYTLPSIQKNIIAKANKACKPVITATQMLLSMTQSKTATRAEISDVANAVLDGTDVVMLSEESAVGIDPVNAVTVMANTIKETEKIYPFYETERFLDDTDVIIASTAMIVKELPIDAILTLTYSGKSAQKIARYRPKQNIYAFTHDNATARSLTIVWGIKPSINLDFSDIQHLETNLLKRAYELGIIKLDGEYLLTSGYPAGQKGSTNLIRVLKKAELEYYIHNGCPNE